MRYLSPPLTYERKTVDISYVVKERCDSHLELSLRGVCALCRNKVYVVVLVKAVEKGFKVTIMWYHDQDDPRRVVVYEKVFENTELREVLNHVLSTISPYSG